MTTFEKTSGNYENLFQCLESRIVALANVAQQVNEETFADETKQEIKSLVFVQSIVMTYILSNTDESQMNTPKFWESLDLNERHPECKRYLIKCCEIFTNKNVKNQLVKILSY